MGTRTIVHTRVEIEAAAWGLKYDHDFFNLCEHNFTTYPALVNYSKSVIFTFLTQLSTITIIYFKSIFQNLFLPTFFKCIFHLITIHNPPKN